MCAKCRKKSHIVFGEIVFVPFCALMVLQCFVGNLLDRRTSSVAVVWLPCIVVTSAVKRGATRTLRCKQSDGYHHLSDHYKP
eukprot:5684226-Amphidinium_carterae.1